MRQTCNLHLQIAPGSFFIVMAHLIPTAKQPRKGTLYTRQEIAIISKYKTEYKDQTTRPLRAHVLRNKILVDIFNYWDQQGVMLSEEVVLQRAKVNYDT